MKNKIKISLTDKIFDFECFDDEERELIESIELAYERNEMIPLTGKVLEKRLKIAKMATCNTMQHIRMSK